VQAINLLLWCCNVRVRMGDKGMQITVPHVDRKWSWNWAEVRWSLVASTCSTSCKLST
jgi:hypothetical protein